ncbi:adenylosuccinate lyase [Salinarchaeum sp. IM2453]|uniref:adenylosuccinate lyase n=1 Tax=Salinarchaeum sp. IM2453 TaxID=2862870 RepID=UPI001C829B30|nr:adenylosuccinate lyase [Salinarchaeum sp. IM2453]QZA88916.1 adenylosuccinate lyase [Salinarchaeum sp. IM2453]
MTDQLYAVSPLDGRYASRTAPLSPYVSEAALMRARLKVEVEYVIKLAELSEIPVEISNDEQAALRETYETFSEEDAKVIKQLETDGYGEYPATNHDVKAIEYYLQLQSNEEIHPWIHFGLTSEDVNNLAYRLLIKDAVQEVLLPELSTRREQLTELATKYSDTSMLARTHGQPATPTAFGKEMAVYADRLEKVITEVANTAEGLAGKLGGASGTYAAHDVAYEEIDWPVVAEEFVTELGLEFRGLTTQVNPCDDLAELFDGLRRANTVLIDLDRDMWLYISDKYLGQEAAKSEAGSSTMPHKVNPIDFENSEGNLSKANSDLTFLADYITTSRLQRDLSDSTVKRNIGTAFAHCLIGYSKAGDGLSKVVPNEVIMSKDLKENPAVIGEAVQTILRREGHDDAYEQVKELTRGEDVTIEDFHELFAELDLPDGIVEELQALTPASYTGVADTLAESVED